MSEDLIVKYGADVLRRQAEEIAEFNDEIRALIQRMYEVMTATRGLGVAGPQVGVSKRIFVYDVGEGQHALINPHIRNASGEEWAIEGCLSMPGLQGEVPRAGKLTVTGINENGDKVKIRAEGLLARVFQHEIDHLNGMIFIDRADPETLETVPIENNKDDSEEE